MKRILIILMLLSSIYGFSQADKFFSSIPEMATVLDTQQILTSNSGVWNKFTAATLRNTIGAKVTASAIGYVPTLTGNVSNLNEFVTDTAGDVWFIDVAGEAIKLKLDKIGFSDFDVDVSATMKFAVGAYLDSSDVTVTSNGTIVSLNIEKEGGGDIKVIFSTGVYVYDATQIQSIALTAGTDISPANNFIYILESTKLLTVSTSGWPVAEFSAVATVLCQSAASVQTIGAYKVHVWTDHMSNGHLFHINKWIRGQSATWLSGVDWTLNINTTPAPDDMYFTSTAGTVSQLHTHTFPAFTDTTTFDYLFVNHPTPYTMTNSIGEVLVDATGGSLSGRYYTYVVWGVVSEDASDCHLMINLPTGSYGTESASLADTDGFNVYDIPTDYTGTAFLIAEVTAKHATGGGGTFTSIRETDLRGKSPSAVSGGGGTATTDFQDDQFTIYDNINPTKITKFEVSGVSTGTTRTLTVPDSDGTIELEGHAHPTYDAKLTSVVAGEGITIDNTNLQSPIIAASPTLGIKNVLKRIPFNTLEPASPTAGDTYISIPRADATNFFAWSDENTKTRWNYNNTGTTVTENVVNDPDGFLTAERWEPTAVSTTHAMQLSNTVQTFDVNDIVTISIYVKADVYTKFRIGDSAIDGFATFDIATQSVTSQGADVLDAGVSDAGGGWYRCYTTFSFSNSIGNGYLYSGFQALDNAGNATFTGDGSGYYVWGTQIQDEGISNYIATAGTTVTVVLPLTGSITTSQTFVQDYLYRWDGLIWEEVIAVAGHTVFVFYDEVSFTYNSTEWSKSKLWLSDIVDPTKIYYNNKVGIGLVPEFELDVSGTFNLQLIGSSNNLNMAMVGNAAIIKHAFNDLTFQSTSTGGYMFKPSSSYDFTIETNTFNTFFVDGTLDRVGVGTNSPAAKLDVVGDFKMTGATAVLGTLPFDTDEAVGSGQDGYFTKYDDGTGLISLQPLPETYIYAEFNTPIGIDANVSGTTSAVKIVSALAASAEWTTTAGIVTKTVTDEKVMVSGSISVSTLAGGSEVHIAMYKNGGLMSSTEGIQYCATAGKTYNISIGSHAVQANTTDTFEMRIWQDVADNMTIVKQGFLIARM